jgi:hypothetical protein
MIVLACPTNLKKSADSKSGWHAGTSQELEKVERKPSEESKNGHQAGTWYLHNHFRRPNSDVRTRVRVIVVKKSCSSFYYSEVSWDPRLLPRHWYHRHSRSQGKLLKSGHAVNFKTSSQKNRLRSGCVHPQKLQKLSIREENFI